MNLTLTQTKLVGLTMKLDLKAQEYKKLCKKLDELKAQNIDENAPELLELRDKFQANHDEIVEINKQLEALKTLPREDFQKEKTINNDFKTNSTILKNENQVFANNDFKNINSNSNQEFRDDRQTLKNEEDVVEPFESENLLLSKSNRRTGFFSRIIEKLKRKLRK